MNADNAELKTRILDTALVMGLESSWDAVRLRSIAQKLGISLQQIHSFYSQKDDLVEALFDRADKAMLELPAGQLNALETPERLHLIIFTWLDALVEVQSLIPQMLGYKMEPLHFHLQVNGILRVSRTIQWVLEIAGIDSTNPRRAVEEAVLTAIYLNTFLYWIADHDSNQQKSRNLLTRRLENASCIFSNPS